VTPQDEERAQAGLLIFASVCLAYAALVYNLLNGYLLLYGDAVAHMAIARRVFDSRSPGLAQLGGVWLPLPHLLMLPFVQRMDWWRNGLAGAWPSMLCYVVSVVAVHGIARRLLPLRWAWVATAFFATNPGLLYLSSTAMSEPLFIALTVCAVYLLMRCADAITRASYTIASIWLMGAGLVLVCAIYTRYDGWVMAAVGWLMAARWIFRRRGNGIRACRSVLGIWFSIFTLLLVLAPLGWLAYNAHYFHDPLDFMHGPYSAQAVEARSATPGAPSYPALHNIPYGSVYYLCAAMMDAAGWGAYLVLALALSGLVLALRRWPRYRTALFFLWIPLPFYAWSVAYGAVPIFVPQLYPHSYYHFRYGLELLPALTISAALAISALEKWLASRWKSAPQWLLRASVLLVLANFILQIIYRPPVLTEALQTSAARIGFEQGIAQALEPLPQDATILMNDSEYVGALQQAAIPLKQTISEFDGDLWQQALDDPAGKAAYIVAISDSTGGKGDAVEKAVQAHPEGLEEISITCAYNLPNQPCARFYRSQLYSAP
jgi:4-amino-4-deoxy-L-arabinose transferase-like glycosyltransferase